jgi:GH25 family lysozyme M1 (1,4-beta-N-acetylmuramidase)
MSNVLHPFGLDVSSHQGVINWDKVAAFTPKVRFVFIRAGQSWGWEDPQFKNNWEGAKRVGIARGAYHVLYPGQPVARQVDNFVSIVGEDQGELAMSGDVELTHNVIPQAYLPTMGEYLSRISDACKRPAICYTRASFIDYYVLGNGLLDPPRWFNDYDWWLAHYLLSGVEHAGPPPLPRGVRRDRVIIHQTSAKGDGLKAGMESAELDLNRWQEPTARLTYAGYLAAYNEQTPPPVDPPQPPPENPCAELIAENEALKADNAKLLAWCDALIAGNEQLEAENKQMHDDLMNIRQATDKWY